MLLFNEMTMMPTVRDQDAKLDYYSFSSLKQQSM